MKKSAWVVGGIAGFIGGLIGLYIYLTAMTHATFQFKNYQCWIEDGMLPYKAFCVKSSSKFPALDMWTGELYILDMRNGAIIRNRSMFNLDGAVK